MRDESTKKFASGWPEGLLAAGLISVPVLVVWATVPGGRGVHDVTLLAGLVAGVLLQIAALTFYFHWLTRPNRRHGWTASAMVVLAAQVLVSSVHELATPAAGLLPWSGAVNLLATAVVLALVLLGGRAGPNPQPLLLGLGLSLALTLLLVFGPVGSLVVAPSARTTGVMLLAMLTAHVAIAWLVLRDRSLVEWARARLALTIVFVGIAHVTRSLTNDDWATDLAAAAALVAAAVLWTSATFVLLRDALHDEHRRLVSLEGSLLEIETDWRGAREQLHEIRSTVAGAASASRLLSDHAIDAGTHAKLKVAISAELDRLERLVSAQPPAEPGSVDLDATLDVLLAAHRAQGRSITFEPTGASVLARSDDVAEALNILLDNAATHGGGASTVAITRVDDRVEIAVSDEGPGVPPERRDEVFDWGARGGDSVGEGIGLNVARRLMTEQDGSLTLAEPSSRGSSFVIRLPAARRSEEDHDRECRHPS